MNRIVLHASDLDGFLTDEDKATIDEIDNMYSRYLELCSKIEKDEDRENAEKALVDNARATGHKLEMITRANPRIHVYSFETPCLFFRDSAGTAWRGFKDNSQAQKSEYRTRGIPLLYPEGL